MNSFSIMIGASNIIVPVVRNLGIYIDSNLTMKNQIPKTVKYATMISHYISQKILE